MIFLLGIIFGLIFAVIAVKRGFYESWVMLVNLVLSVYLGIFAAPWIAGFGGMQNIPFVLLISVLGVSVVSFLIFSGISYVYFTSQFYIPFGKLFDFLGAGIVGFLSGFLVWSFISIPLCSSLESMELPIINRLNISRSACSSNIGYLGWWTNLVHTFTASEDNPQSTTVAISQLAGSIKQQVGEDLPSSLSPSPESSTEPASPNEPNQPPEPNLPVEANQPAQPSELLPPDSPSGSNVPGSGNEPES